MEHSSTFRSIASASLPGMAHGQAQPTLFLSLQVVPRRSPDWASVDRVLDELLEEEPVPAAEGPETDAAGLLRRMLHLQGAVQRHQKIPVFGPGRILSLGEAGEARAVTGWYQERTSTIAIAWAMDTLCMLAQDDTFSRTEVQARFDKCNEELRPLALKGINTFHFLTWAHRIGMPAGVFVQDAYRFGEGVHHRVLRSTMTDRTSALATSTAHRKMLTASVLRRHGVPVPQHRMVRSADEAVQAAQALGYPVVVKPDDQEQGHGVAAGLRTEAAVRSAWKVAAGVSKHVLVEQYQPGTDYRITVLEGEIVKIQRREPGGVRGDGTSDVATLVRLAKESQRFQRLFHQTGRFILDLDAEALDMLQEQGLDAASVPSEGVFVPLRRKANISAGGTQYLVPVQECHPDNAALAVRACRALGLDLCGVDFIIEDIGKSWFDIGCAIIEMNAQPQVGVAYAPEVYARILERLVGATWRIPLYLVVCDRRELPDSPEALAALLPDAPLDFVTLPAGAWVGGRRIARAQPNAFAAASIALVDRTAASAACAMSAADVLRFGLPSERFERIVLRRPPNPDERARVLWGRVAAMVREHTQDLREET
jgi:cyanophycin synthetase